MLSEEEEGPQDREGPAVALGHTGSTGSCAWARRVSGWDAHCPSLGKCSPQAEHPGAIPAPEVHPGLRVEHSRRSRGCPGRGAGFGVAELRRGAAGISLPGTAAPVGSHCPPVGASRSRRFPCRHPAVPCRHPAVPHRCPDASHRECRRVPSPAELSSAGLAVKSNRTRRTRDVPSCPLLPLTAGSSSWPP